MHTRLLARLAFVVALGALVAFPVAGYGATTLNQAKPKTVILTKGVFTDSAKYTGSGNALVRRRGKVRTLVLARNFQADPGSIRLRLYLAADATGRDFVDLGAMAESGAQRFAVPRRVNLGRYRYVIAWCAAVDEPITQALMRRVK